MFLQVVLTMLLLLAVVFVNGVVHSFTVKSDCEQFNFLLFHNPTFNVIHTIVVNY